VVSASLWYSVSRPFRALGWAAATPHRACCECRLCPGRRCVNSLWTTP